MQHLTSRVRPGSPLGRFEVVSHLGSGGMGDVFRATDTRLGRDVAIKVLPPHLADDTRRRRRFLREAKLLASLNHPNIATIHGLEESGGLEYLVLELIRGPTLSEVIADGSLDVDDALRIAREIADALAAAHEAGVIHRDLKPSNVMLTAEGRTKVLDFGLAKRVKLDVGDSAGGTPISDDLTRTGVFVGTPAYMSPERLENEEPDERADVWSLGCILYEMLSGRRAFQGATPLATLTAIVTTEPDWNALPASLPRHVRRFLTRCLEKDPSVRPARLTGAVVETEGGWTGSEAWLGAPLVPEARAKAGPSIAVLPFANLSDTPDTEYIGHGLAEELIHELGRVPGMRVAARTSSFRVGGGRFDITEIGRQLDVDTVLEGSVRISRDRIRVTAQLVDSADGFQLWSERFDRAAQGVFEIQDEIAAAIVEKLEVELAGSDPGSPLVRRYTESLEAQTLFMKGRYYWEKRHEVGLKKSMEHFQRAIAADPEHAGAHAGLADAYWSIGGYLLRPPETMLPKAEAAALRALRIDDGHPGARLALGMVRFTYDWDWEAAEREMRRAIGLNPHASSPHGYYSLLLALLGRTDEAVAEAETCRALDPFSAGAHGRAALSMGIADQRERAIEVCRQGLAMEPDSYGDRWVLAWLFERSGRHAEAVSMLEDLTERFGRRGMLLSMLGHALAASGRDEAARRVLSELHRAATDAFVSPAFIAWVHAGLGEADEASEWMERAFEQRSNPLAFALYDGFDDFRRRSGLPP